MIINRFLYNLRPLRLIHRNVPNVIIIKSVTSSSSANKVELTMKRLIESKRYAEVVNLYHQPSHSSNAICSTLALKACTKLGDYESGVGIHQQLSSQSLKNPFIQTSLIHFYSKRD